MAATRWTSSRDRSRDPKHGCVSIRQQATADCSAADRVWSIPERARRKGRAGGRGKAGGVKLARSSEEVRAAAAGLLGTLADLVAGGLPLERVLPLVTSNPADQYGLRGRITSQNPLRPGNAPDPWEADALEVLARQKLTGEALYTDDLVFPGAWYGATIRSTEAHAKLLGLEQDG